MQDLRPLKGHCRQNPCLFGIGVKKFVFPRNEWFWLSFSQNNSFNIKNKRLQKRAYGKSATTPRCQFSNCALCLYHYIPLFFNINPFWVCWCYGISMRSSQGTAVNINTHPRSYKLLFYTGRESGALSDPPTVFRTNT